MGAERRTIVRWDLNSLKVAHVTSLDQLELVASSGQLVEASSRGFKIILDREDLIPKLYRSNLSLDPLVGHKLSLEIEAMNLDITGTVVRTRLLGKGLFEVGVDYTAEAPEYWRECLVDLLPKIGEDEEE